MVVPGGRISETDKSILSQLSAQIPVLEDVHNTLERKIQYNFLLMSSVAAILVALNGELKVEPLPGGLKIFAVFYLIIVISSIYVLWPRGRFIHPINPKWEIVQKWRNYPSDEYVDQLILGYEMIAKNNESLLQTKAFFTRLSLGLTILGLLAVLFEMVN